MRCLRTIHSVPTDYGAFQRLYINTQAKPRWLRPDLLFLDSDGSINFETNEIGLKAGPIDPNREQAVVWGDSVAFGLRSGWPALLDEYFPAYQFLNGGIEGDGWNVILERALKLNREMNISLNLLMLGWHHINEGLAEELTSALQHLPNPVMITMPTSLNRRNFEYDISAYLRPGLYGPLDFDSAFWFGGGRDYSIDVQIEYYRKIMERNAISCTVAADLHVPVIDLASALDTEALPDFRQDFYDIMHPRPSAYSKIARIVADELRRLRIL
jgi:lysophospholipase L1-like esterase